MARRISMFATLVLASAFALLGTGARAGAAPSPLPQPRHVVVIVEENKTLAQVVGGGKAPFIAALAHRGALFTAAHGITHPSLPNYFALFAGLTNTNGDDCPAAGIDVSAPNLASELLARRLSFAGYAEGLPETGSTACSAGEYARKHAPWVAFRNVPRTANLPLGALPARFDRLPTVAMIVPDLDDDMHDGTIKAGDDWLKTHLGTLVRWADAHDTLVVLTWDEGFDSTNSIPTIFYGPMVRPGTYGERIDHYRVLRTFEDMYGLAPTGAAGHVRPIADCWVRAPHERS